MKQVLKQLKKKDKRQDREIEKNRNKIGARPTSQYVSKIEGRVSELEQKITDLEEELEKVKDPKDVTDEYIQ